MSLFLFLQSILSVCGFHCRSSTFFRQFSLSLFSAVHLSSFNSILYVICFHCRSFRFFRQFSLSIVYDVVLSLDLVRFSPSFSSVVVPPCSFINSPCLWFPLFLFSS